MRLSCLRHEDSFCKTFPISGMAQSLRIQLAVLEQIQNALILFLWQRDSYLFPQRKKLSTNGLTRINIFRDERLGCSLSKRKKKKKRNFISYLDKLLEPEETFFVWFVASGHGNSLFFCGELESAKDKGKQKRRKLKSNYPSLTMTKIFKSFFKCLINESIKYYTTFELLFSLWIIRETWFQILKFWQEIDNYHIDVTTQRNDVQSHLVWNVSRPLDKINWKTFQKKVGKYFKALLVFTFLFLKKR